MSQAYLSQSHFIRRMVLLSMALFAVACDSQATDPTLADSTINKPFTCTHEKDHLPPIDPKVDSLYRYARYLEKQNRIKEDPTRFPMMERLYRIASAHDDYRANLSLRHMILKWQAHSEDRIKDILDLIKRQIQQNLARGYYDMGIYTEKGIGVKQDEALAIRYYRKAADMGSPEGQYYVSGKIYELRPHPQYIKSRSTMIQQLLLCAADQGHPHAAESYVKRMASTNTLPYYQKAVKNGSANAAILLATEVFAHTPSPYSSNHDLYPDSDDMVAKDPERARRYKIIYGTLSEYDDQDPSVPELDEIVPLPPAPLPPWDGKIQWLKDWEANIPPPKPSEALITELARAKQLDPKTGRPYPAQEKAK